MLKLRNHYIWKPLYLPLQEKPKLMKSSILPFIATLLLFCACRNENAPVVEMAEFPGGKSAMTDFLVQEMRYPETAIENNYQGKCIVKFAVDVDGTIRDIRVSRNVPNCPECDREALRVVKLMPKWIPGHIDGKPVRSHFELPVNFQLE